MIHENLVLIRWLDATSYEGHEWRTAKEVKELTSEFMLSVGWIVKETADSIVLVSHRDHDSSPEDHSVAGEMAIPVGAILECRELKLGRIKHFNKKRKK